MTSFKKIMQKVVNIIAKMDLKTSIIIQNLDVYYLKNYCLSHITSLKI